MVEGLAEGCRRRELAARGRGRRAARDGWLLGQVRPLLFLFLPRARLAAAVKTDALRTRRSIWADGETNRLVELVRTKLDAAASARPSSEAAPSRSTADAALASSVAQTAVNFARVVSVRADVQTPFAAEAKRWDVKGMVGGKVDDVTVVCAVVRKGDAPSDDGQQ